MKSILVQTNSLAFKYGGGSTGLISICQALVKNKNFKISLISYSNELTREDQHLIKRELINVNNIYLKELRFRIPKLKSFIKLIKEIRNNQIIYIHSLSSVFSIITFLISKIFDKKTIFRPHGSVMRVYTNKFSLIKHILVFIQFSIFKYADAIIVSSEIELKELKEYDFLNLINYEKVRIIHESLGEKFNIGIEIKDFPEREIDFLYVGRINSEKGIFEFLNFFNKIIKNKKITFRKVTKIRICGPCNKTNQILLDYHLDKLNKFKKLDLKFSGFISKEQRNSFYNNSKYFFYPTYGDCFGLSVLEAAYYGCRIISTKNLGIYRLLNKIKILDLYQRSYKKDLPLFKNIFDIDGDTQNYSNKNIKKELDKYFGFKIYIQNYNELLNLF